MSEFRASLLPLPSICVFISNWFSPETVQPPSLLEPLIASSSVTLEWWYNEDDRSHPAFITGYFATVHKVEHDKPLDHASMYITSKVFFSVLSFVLFSQ